MSRRSDGGTALVLAVMALALLAAFGVSLSILTTIDARAAANIVQAQDAEDAAQAALEVVAREIEGHADWNAVVTGAVASTFVSGAPGTQPIPDGSTVDLTHVAATFAEPGWRLFAFGTARQLGNLPSDACVAVWVRASTGTPETLVLRADAFAAGGTRRAVMAALSRSGLRWWKAVR